MLSLVFVYTGESKIILINFWFTILSWDLIYAGFYTGYINKSCLKLFLKDSTISLHPVSLLTKLYTVLKFNIEKTLIWIVDMYLMV